MEGWRRSPQHSFQKWGEQDPCCSLSSVKCSLRATVLSFYSSLPTTTLCTLSNTGRETQELLGLSIRVSCYNPQGPSSISLVIQVLLYCIFCYGISCSIRDDIHISILNGPFPYSTFVCYSEKYTQDACGL